MTRNIPVAGEFYRHFKGNIYQIKSIATDSETGKKIVVYQAMYPPFGMWVRSLDMFMSETDHQKYPECNQQFRFEKVVFDSQCNVHGAERIFFSRDEVDLHRVITYNDNMKNNRRYIRWGTEKNNYKWTA